MFHLEGAVLSSTVFYIDNTASATVLNVTRITKVHISAAVEESHRATIAALPVDVCFAVGFTLVATSPKVFKEARLAAQVFLLYFFPLFLSHF